ncbi:hypothetical protein QTG56_11235 [Rossellomorea sp. AcN35-11]|nr:hypothetical protein [Rossellomorea aquimaris]WJV31438.1 hypothetical protein QTG56_11235 [Rossellomorea sp. AcN35-11]
MDKSDKVLFDAIEQRKFSSMPTDLFNKEGDPVDINGVKGYYKPFSNAPGGILTWIQGGTYIEMSSSEKNKVEMIEIAGSMKGYK